MTGSVKELTDHATPEPSGSAVAAVSYSARDVRALLDALERLGYDTTALLAAAGLKRSELEDPDAPVACTTYAAILEHSQRDRPTKNLALKLAAATPIGAYPLVDYLVLTAPTVGDGLRQLARYFRLISAPIVLGVQDEESPIRVAVCTTNRFGVEYCAALTILNLRKEAEGRLEGVALSLRHRPDDLSELERVLGCPVRAAANWDGIQFTSAAWRLPLRRRDPVLRSLLERQADEMIARLAKKQGYAAEVQRVLAPLATGGDTRIAAVARHLAVSPRTLQRRLEADGVSYQDLLDQARLGAAEAYLSDSGLSVGEVGYLLGYSEPAAFHRAFKRWHGTTPREFRMARRR